MRAAFSYYVQGLLRRRVNLRQRCRRPHAMSRPGFSGWEEGPTIDRSSGRYAGAPLTFLQGRRGLCASRSGGARQPGGLLPAMAQCSCADPPPPAAEAPKGQARPSGGCHSSRRATPAGGWRSPRRSGWGFSKARSWRAGARWSRGGRAQRSPPSRRFVGGGKGSCRVAVGRAGGCCQGSGSWGPRDGDRGCSRAPRAHPAQAGGRGGPGGRRPPSLARHALRRN